MSIIDMRAYEASKRQSLVTEYLIYPNHNITQYKYPVLLTSVPSFSLEDVTVVLDGKVIKHFVETLGNVWIEIPIFEPKKVLRVYTLTGATSIKSSSDSSMFNMFLNFESSTDGYSTGSSSTTQKKIGKRSFQLGANSTLTVSVPNIYSLVTWLYPTNTAADGTLQFRHNSTNYAYIGKGYVAGKWSYYIGAWTNTGLAITANKWVRMELKFHSGNYDIYFDNKLYISGASYIAGNLQYIMSSTSLFADGQIIRKFTENDPTIKKIRSFYKKIY